MLRRQIQDLCHKVKDKEYSEGANDLILEIISQEFLVKKEVGSPLKILNLQG